MRNRLLILLSLLLTCFAAQGFAQNAAPVVSNLNAVLDTANRQVTVSFDLNDAEGDLMDVWLRVSGDDGRTWRVPVDTLAGDAGFPISGGNGRSITWTYDCNVLSNLLGAGPQVLTLRVTADDRQPIDIAEIVAQVDSSRMMGALAYLEGIRHRSAGPAHHQAVRDSLSALRDADGLQDWNYDFTSFGLQGHNLIGRQAGLWDDAPTWYISAHFDSEINTPGVDDNASGTIAVVEAMHVLSQYSFRESIRYMGFDLEEDGLLGSFNYVQSEVQDWEDVQGCLNMEMIGYYDDTPNSQGVPTGFSLFFPDAYAQVQADSFRGNFLTNVSNTNSEWLMEQFDSCAAQYVPGLRVIHISTPGSGLATPDLRRSDHASFWDAGHAALMLTDGANLRNPNYHQPGDSLSTITPWFYVSSAKAVIATLTKQAQPIHAGSASSQGLPITLPVFISPSILSQSIHIYPNPNDGRCRIELELPHSGPLKVQIMGVNGQSIATLYEGTAQAGKMSMEWDGRAHPTGTYLLTVDFEGKKAVVKDLIQR